jgi:hypothetical protein
LKSVFKLKKYAMLKQGEEEGGMRNRVWSKEYGVKEV